jgi:hypothetical protein
MVDLDDDDDLEDEDSGVYGAILDLRMGLLDKLESDWVGGPHAHDAGHAKATLAECRVALEKISKALDAQGKRDLPITVSGREVGHA